MSRKQAAARAAAVAATRQVATGPAKRFVQLPPDPATVMFALAGRGLPEPTCICAGGFGLNLSCPVHRPPDVAAALADGGNRTYEPAYLAQGERALIARALQHLISDYQQMISAAVVKYKGKGAKAETKLADHRQHHQKQIAAAAALLARFDTRSVNNRPLELTLPTTEGP